MTSVKMKYRFMRTLGYVLHVFVTINIYWTQCKIDFFNVGNGQKSLKNII